MPLLFHREMKPNRPAAEGGAAQGPGCNGAEFNARRNISR